jgi:hypothetical protein
VVAPTSRPSLLLLCCALLSDVELGEGWGRREAAAWLPSVRAFDGITEGQPKRSPTSATLMYSGKEPLSVCPVPGTVRAEDAA